VVAAAASLVVVAVAEAVAVRESSREAWSAALLRVACAAPGSEVAAVVAAAAKGFCSD